jgi:hypothetical protein
LRAQAVPLVVQLHLEALSHSEEATVPLHALAPQEARSHPQSGRSRRHQVSQMEELAVLAHQALLQPMVALEPTTPICRTTQWLEPLAQVEALAQPQAPLELKHLALLARALLDGLAVVVQADSLPLALRVRLALHQTAALAQGAAGHQHDARITCAAR